MTEDRQIITLNGQQYSFHKTVKTEQLETLQRKINEFGALSKFNQIYGKIASPEEKDFRKFLRAIIRARNNPINKGKKVITVKLSDRSIKLRPLYL